MKIDLDEYFDPGDELVITGNGRSITIILPDCENMEPDPEIVTSPVGLFNFGVSDEDDHLGEYYFIIDPGPYKSLTIGGKPYEKKAGGYNGRELWYGKGQGDILLIAQDGSFYAGKTGDVVESGGSEGKYILKYKGLSNGNRPTYYTYNGRHLAVGDRVEVKVGGIHKTFTAKKRTNGSIGYDWPDGTVVKNSEVSGRGVAVLTPAGSGSHSGGWIKW